MNPRIAFPFLTLSDHSIEAGPWMLRLDDGDESPARDYLADWDYASSISLQRTISLNRALAAAELDIDASELALTLCVRVGTGHGRLPRSIISQQQRSFGDELDTLNFEMKVPGHVLSSVLDLMTEIVIERVPDKRGELSPSRPFERVWYDSLRIRLEGEEPRFPIEVANFGRLLPAGIAKSAPWFVHWSPGDWSRDFHGSMRLYLNRDFPEFIDRVTQGDPETLRAVMADVMGQVCEHFLTLDECVDLAESYEEGSLGSQAARWIKAAWPDNDLSFVQSQLRNRPGTFRATMHALAEQRGTRE